ncbi:MAG: thioredoxin family protein [Opitutus sp.]
MKSPHLRLIALATALLALGLGCARKTEAAASAPAPAPDVAAVKSTPPAPATTAATAPQPAPEKRLPRMVDIGAGTCIPCKMMKPILAELMATRAHQFETIYIDLNHERAKGLSYGIRLIPTQVFFDENDRELFRHEGFLSKDQILTIWSQLGFPFEPRS